MTRAAFLAAYRRGLVAWAPWAQDTGKLDRFMESVAETISTTRKTWIHDGPTTINAWRAIGGKGRPTLKALRALP